MARLFSSGFELNSLVDGVEFSSPSQGTIEGASFSISSSNPISGNYSLRLNPSGDTFNDFYHDFASNDRQGKVYYRIKVKLISYPTNAFKILSVKDSGGVPAGSLEINQSGVLVVRCADDTSSTGNIASPLKLNTVYTVEFMCDTSSFNGTEVPSVAYEGRVTGFPSFGIGTFDATGLGLQGQHTMGIVEAHLANTFDMYMDDIAINDTTGSYQNSWCGEGKIIHLRPNGAGDNNTFATQVGGTAGAGNNFTRVKEVIPDDATSYNADTVTGHIDDFDIDNTSIGVVDTINVVQVGARYAASVASAESAFVLRCKKASGGTVSESPAITPNATSWNTNANAAPHTYPLTLYNDPDGNSWLKATVNTTQIGYRISSGNTNAAQISALWMLVEYVPASSVPVISIQNTSYRFIDTVVSY